MVLIILIDGERIASSPTAYGFTVYCMQVHVPLPGASSSTKLRWSMCTSDTSDYVVD